MQPLFNEFITYLDQYDKDKCVQLVTNKLAEGTVDIVSLYEKIIVPSQQVGTNSFSLMPLSIWEEHIRTSIIRTVIECCYPFAVRERDAKYHSSFRGRVIVACPPGELHEIGARLVADYFTLCGFKADFIGANTPLEDIVESIRAIQPRLVALSVTNYFNLVAARSTVEKILRLKNQLAFQLILGGIACQDNLPTCQQMGADRLLNSFGEIRKLAEESPDVLP